MKKVYILGLLCMLPFTVLGCGPNQFKNEVNKQVVDEKPSETKENEDSKELDEYKDYEEVDYIEWKVAGNLEAQKGQDKNIGTAGLLQGKANDYIVVGGGANFPEKSVLEGGPKKHYPDIYVLEEEDGILKQVNHTTLDYEIGYGSSISDEDGIYYIGGSPDKEAGNNVTLIIVDDKGNVKVDQKGDLPFTFSDGFAVKKNNFIYLGLGKQDGKASNKIYKFDLDTKKTEELAPMPGELTRNQAVAQLLGDDIYVFSGGDKIAYTDGYKYNIKDNTWTQVSDVFVNGEKISLLGASSIKLNEEEMLVIGGFNKEVYDYAVKNLGELKDEALEDFRDKYFRADPEEFKWNKNVLIYNAKENKWRSVGEIPFNAPCGEALILDGDNIFSINGEIKPGVRTSRMYSGEIEYK